MNTLQSRLFRYFVPILLIFALVIGFVSLLSVRKYNEQYVHANTVNLLTSIKYNIDQGVEQLNQTSMDTIYAIKKSPSFINMQMESYEQLYRNSYSELQEIYSKIFSLIGTNLKVNQINIFFKSGIALGNGYDTKLISYNYSELPYYEEVIRKKGSKYISADVNVEGISHHYKDHVILARTFMNQADEGVGIVEVAQTKQRFFDYISNLAYVGNNLEVYLFDQQTKELVYPYDTEDRSEEELLYMKEYYSMVQDKPPLQHLSVHNSYSSNRTVVMYDQLESYNWDVLVVQPETFIMAPFNKEIIKFGLLAGMLILLVASLYKVVMTKTLRPLNILKSNVNKIDLNKILSDEIELTPNLNIKTQEIDLLNHAFEQMYVDLRQSALSIITLKERESDSNYRALQAIVDPHFIFNSLTTITVMAEDNRNEELIRMTNNLCQLLRYSSNRSVNTVYIREEMAVVDKYLECLQIRYGGDLEYSIDIVDELCEISIPKLSIQTLVENCMKHGFQISPPFRVHITGRMEEDHWWLRVEDNGIGFDPARQEEVERTIDEAVRNSRVDDISIGGSGLLNVVLRMSLKDSQSFYHIENNRDRGCAITIGQYKL